MDILVVGDGVSGLTTALRLLEAGHRVAIWAEEPPEETTSSVAAAIWYPYAVAAPNVREWGKSSFEWFQRLEDVSGSGVVMRETIDLHHEPAERPWWSTVVEGFRDTTADELPQGHREGWVFRAPVIDMSRYLSHLRQLVTARQGTIARRTVASWTAVFDAWREAFPASTDQPAERRVIVNCAGVRAGALAEDDERTSPDGLGVYPARGQVVRIAPTGFDRVLLDDSDPGRPTYIVPRIDDIVLGGTFQPNVTSLEPEPATRSDILMRCATLVRHYDPRLALSVARLAGGDFAADFATHGDADLADTPPARIVSEGCGLRPVRAAVRVERQELGEDRTVVHNYGHGGAGVTLSWGCAEEVERIIASLGR